MDVPLYRLNRSRIKIRSPRIMGRSTESPSTAEMEYYTCADNMKIQHVMSTRFTVTVFKNNSLDTYFLTEKMFRLGS